MAGDVVTSAEFIADESEWVMHNIRASQMRRLRWMLDHTAARG
jgi:hypothetical protein